ncbi:hypothetical protein K435DRAFT_771760 [Dendrothele bispora CBS 962.96]|uniref:tRNA (guanine(9)-N1)-methyltransferase n=1 Tax=Dendrothele bispora (strain CBS 962.96) TaxID=1314807 RepID=A0A4S8MXR6_DENBC|nr:hypothetical protein K435DRAFT_771760 [Dendrothele bispora CBS 962.96]
MDVTETAVLESEAIESVAEDSALETTEIELNTDSQTENAPGPAPSKKSLKKAKKLEAIRESRLRKRAQEKEARKEKKREKARKRDAGELDDTAEQEEQAAKKRKTSGFGGKVVIDLGFDDLMSEKEINSLCTQLAYTYSNNRSFGYPFELICSSLNGKTHARLENIGDAAHRRWQRTEWWSDGYDKLWSTVQDTGAEHPHTIKKTVVYLTADSEEEIEELESDEIYIIGGICDHNRYKNLTLKKANEQGIRTARLPIGKYVASLPTRKVLTVNQVFEIMLKWVETRSWEQAFYSIIPQRKFQKDGKGGKGVEPKNEVEQDGATTVIVKEIDNEGSFNPEDLSHDVADSVGGSTEVVERKKDGFSVPETAVVATA